MKYNLFKDFAYKIPRPGPAHSGQGLVLDVRALNPNVPTGWVRKVQKNYLPKEEGREGGEKKRAQRACWAWGSNPGPAAVRGGSPAARHGGCSDKLAIPCL